MTDLKRMYQKNYDVGNNFERSSMSHMDSQYRENFISKCGGLDFSVINPEEYECLKHVPFPHNAGFALSRNQKLTENYGNLKVKTWRNLILLTLLLEKLPNSTIFQEGLDPRVGSNGSCIDTLRMLYYTNFQTRLPVYPNTYYSSLRSDSYRFQTCDGIKKDSIFKGYVKPYTFICWMFIIATLGVLSILFLL